jgi:hypothetical protein
MLRLIAVALLSLSFSVTAVSQEQNHPCKPKHEAKMAAHKALRECLENWGRDNRPGEADPTDDCSGKLSAFIQASKDIKACRASAKESRQHERQEKRGNR